MHKWRRAGARRECVKGAWQQLGRGNILLYATVECFRFVTGLSECVCHAPLASHARHSICIISFAWAGRGTFLTFVYRFLANFLHQVHLYKYYLYFCFFFFMIFSVLQCILSGKYFTVSFVVYI